MDMIHWIQIWLANPSRHYTRCLYGLHTIRRLFIHSLRVCMYVVCRLWKAGLTFTGAFIVEFLMMHRRHALLNHAEARDFVRPALRLSWWAKWWLVLLAASTCGTNRIDRLINSGHLFPLRPMEARLALTLYLVASPKYWRAHIIQTSNSMHNPKVPATIHDVWPKHSSWMINSAGATLTSSS